MFGEDDTNPHLEVAEHLEEDRRQSEALKASDNIEPAGIVTGAENDKKTESSENDDNHMKETDENINKYMTDDSAPTVTPISVVPSGTPILGPTNDKTSKTDRN